MSKCKVSPLLPLRDENFWAKDAFLNYILVLYPSMCSSQCNIPDIIIEAFLRLVYFLFICWFLLVSVQFMGTTIILLPRFIALNLNWLLPFEYSAKLILLHFIKKNRVRFFFIIETNQHATTKPPTGCVTGAHTDN